MLSIKEQIKHLLKTAIDYYEKDEYEAAEVLTRQAYNIFNENFNTEDDLLAKNYIAKAQNFILKKDIKQALDLFQQAYKLNSGFKLGFLGYLFCLFELKKYKDAWELYEDRLNLFDSLISFQRIFKDAKKWDGKKELKEKTVLIDCEQGLGDQINFIRYTKVLKERHKCKIKLLCAKPLKELFEKLEISEVIHCKEEINSDSTINFDYYVPQMSLPYLLKEFDPITFSDPYINYTSKFNFPEKEFKIGIMWQGSDKNLHNEERLVKPEFFEILISEKIKLFNLHNELECPLPEVKDLTNYIDNFLDLAKIINGLDLVITIDTAVLHLAGAMGKETWAILPFQHGWRWGLSEEINWYKSVKIFRQPKPNDWNTVFLKIRDELHKCHLKSSKK